MLFLFESNVTQALNPYFTVHSGGARVGGKNWCKTARLMGAVGVYMLGSWFVGIPYGDWFSGFLQVAPQPFLAAQNYPSCQDNDDRFY